MAGHTLISSFAGPVSGGAQSNKFISIKLALTIIFIASFAGCSIRNRTQTPMVSPVKATPESSKPTTALVGTASYYHHSLHGRQTANGERYDQNELTAAHRSLPFGTKLRVTNLSNEHSVNVRINDRGPFVKGRILDLSGAAARKLRMNEQGVAKVRAEIIESEDESKTLASDTPQAEPKSDTDTIKADNQNQNARN